VPALGARMAPLPTRRTKPFHHNELLHPHPTLVRGFFVTFFVVPNRNAHKRPDALRVGPNGMRIAAGAAERAGTAGFSCGTRAAGSGRSEERRVGEGGAAVAARER